MYNIILCQKIQYLNVFLFRVSGILPFYADSDVEIFKMIIAAQYEWKSPQFDNVSSEGNIKFF